MKKKNILLAALLAVGMMSFGGVGEAAKIISAKEIAATSQMKHASVQELNNDTRVFALDKSIIAKKVRFQNRYGFEVAGHLYLPKNFDINKKY